MKKVLHIINSLSTGGAEKLMVDILPLLKKTTDSEILILSSQDSEFFMNKIQMHSIKIHQYHLGIYNPFWILKIRKILPKYDLVHVHLFPSLYWASMAVRLNRKNPRLIYTEHNTHNRRRDYKLLRRIERIIYSTYERIICISVGVQDKLVDHIGQQIGLRTIVINNGVHIERFSKAIPLKISHIPWDISFEKITILMVARFSESKDQQTAIRSLTTLDNRFQLALAGEGPKKENCMDLVSSLKLKQRVYFLGIRKDIPELMKTADICLLSSNWEGFGIVAVEAMASGTPLIASDVSGLSEIVGDGGLLFEKGNYKELAGLIEKLASNKELSEEISKKAQQQSSKFTIERMAESYSRVYLNIVD